MYIVLLVHGCLTLKVGFESLYKRCALICTTNICDKIILIWISHNHFKQKSFEFQQTLAICPYDIIIHFQLIFADIYYQFWGIINLQCIAKKVAVAFFNILKSPAAHISSCTNGICLLNQQQHAKNFSKKKSFWPLELNSKFLE